MSPNTPIDARVCIPTSGTNCRCTCELRQPLPSDWARAVLPCHKGVHPSVGTSRHRQTRGAAACSVHWHGHSWQRGNSWQCQQCQHGRGAHPSLGKAVECAYIHSGVHIGWMECLCSDRSVPSVWQGCTPQPWHALWPSVCHTTWKQRSMHVVALSMAPIGSITLTKGQQ